MQLLPETEKFISRTCLLKLRLNGVINTTEYNLIVGHIESLNRDIHKLEDQLFIVQEGSQAPSPYTRGQDYV